MCRVLPASECRRRFARLEYYSGVICGVDGSARPICSRQDTTSSSQPDLPMVRTELLALLVTIPVRLEISLVQYSIEQFLLLVCTGPLDCQYLMIHDLEPPSTHFSSFSTRRLSLSAASAS